MKFAVISMGQFISSDLGKLKEGFTQYFRDFDKDKLLTGEHIWEWMSKNLDPLRKDEISLEQFCQNLNDHFKTTIPFTEFQKIFNSMVAMNNDSLQRVSKFTELLKQNPEITLLLISHTNHCHLKFILDQVAHCLPSSYGVISIRNDWPQDARILFVPSMSSKCPEHPGTLDYALKKLEVDQNTPVVSFLNTIQTFPHPKFKYIKAAQPLDPYILMDEVNERTRLERYLGLAKRAIVYAKGFIPLGPSVLEARDNPADEEGYRAAVQAMYNHDEDLDELCRNFRKGNHRYPSYFELIRLCNYVTKNFKAGNCSHQSFLALEYLLQQTIRPVGIVVILDDKRQRETQTMVIIGDPSEDAVICDPLHNQCYPYQDFFDPNKKIKARDWGNNLNLKFMRSGAAPINEEDSKDVEYKPVKELLPQVSSLSLTM